jgi:hypothetical protein
VFVYSKRQEDLAGKDGVEAFRDVFRHRSRLVVLMFRSPWGDTPWTRVEKTAIEELCLEEGWEHLVAVRLDETPLPKWVPKPHLYLDLRTFTLSDLVGAIKGRLLEIGVEIVKPSAAERAAAVRRQQDFDKETAELLGGTGAFNEASNALCDSITAIAKDVSERTGWKIKTGPGYYIGGFIISGMGTTLQLVGKDLYANTARDAYLEIIEYYIAFPIAEAGKRYNLWDEHMKYATIKRLDVRRLPDLGWCWEMDGRTYPIPDAADAVVQLFLDRIETKPRRR